MIWTSRLSRWWRVSPASATTRLERRFISNPNSSSQDPVDTTLETAETLRASSPSSSESSQAQDADRENGHPKKTSTSITADEARKFVELHEKGLSKREIRLFMPNRSYHSLTSMVWRYKRGDLANLLSGTENSERFTWTGEEKKRLLELHQTNATQEKILSSFPTHTAQTVLQAVKRPDWDPFWSSTKHRQKKWTDEELVLFRRSVAQGVDWLEISRSLGRSVQSLTSKARTLGLLVKTRRWRPENDKELLRLRSEGLEEAEIASRLGRATNDVEKRVAIRSKDAYIAEFRLTLAEMQAVNHMLDQGIDWQTIQWQNLPQFSVELLQMKYGKRVTELDGQPPLIWRMTHEDEADIARLLAEKRSWAQIAELKYPTYSGMCVASMWSWLKFEKHSSQRLPISWAITDMQGIKILRWEKKKWPEIRDLKYPEWPVDTVRKAYNRWSKCYDKVEDTMSAAEKEDIRGLLAEDKTWSQIGDLRYPKWSQARVREVFRRQPAQRSKVRPKLTMCANDLKDINRMLGEGKNFMRIRDIKFPVWSEK